MNPSQPHFLRRGARLRSLVLGLTTLVSATTASAQPTPLNESGGAAAARPWSDASSAQTGSPVVIHVIVALCSNEYLYCGGRAKGDPTDLDGNLYWGALFGARRMFDSQYSPWTKISSTRSTSGPVLEHLVYSKRGGPFGEVFVSLEAWNGNHTDQAIERFWNIATGGGQTSFQGRTERIHAVGFAGYNRLMDDVELPGPASGQAIPSFVLAKSSERTFGRKLREAGSFPLITTKGSMAPEGYTITAAARALADNYSPRAIRVRMIEEYKRYQKIPEREASFTFAWPHR